MFYTNVVIDFLEVEHGAKASVEEHKKGKVWEKEGVGGTRCGKRKRGRWKTWKEESVGREQD